jgi:saccharopine dehydrogenase-like NADP-dependent oxidoreductase
MNKTRIAILEDASIDAVVVLTPPNTHLEIVKRCAVAGKHVLLEAAAKGAPVHCRPVGMDTW